MKVYLPYIVSVICAAISGFTSYIVTRRQMRAELQKLEKQYELDIEKEREKFAMEKEKMEIEHKYQLELKQKEADNNFNTSATNTILNSVMKMPEIRQQISQGIKNGSRRHK